MLKFRCKVHVFIDKGPYIGILLNDHVGRLPGPMPGIRIDADHYGVLTAVLFLKSGSI